jgi:hypothetical protein
VLGEGASVGSILSTSSFPKTSVRIESSDVIVIFSKSEMLISNLLEHFFATFRGTSQPSEELRKKCSEELCGTFSTSNARTKILLEHCRQPVAIGVTITSPHLAVVHSSQVSEERIMRLAIAVATTFSGLLAVASAQQCRDNLDCTNPNSPLCSTDSTGLGRCVECEYDGDQNCRSGYKYCLDGDCVECSRDEECGWPTYECDDDGFCEEPLCFSGRSLVDVQGQGTVPMDRLQIGDYVRVRNGSYSRVHSFGHYQPKAKGNFLQILTTDAGKPIEITAEHMIYVINTANKREEVVPAGEVKIGDCLVADGGPTKVIAINKVRAVGLCSPLTTTGDIVVNGVLASNYVTRSWLPSRVPGGTLHLLQHGAAASHRMICEWFGCPPETYDEVTGFSPLVSFFFGLEQWQLRLGIVPRILFFSALAPFAILAFVVGMMSVAPVAAAIHLVVVLVGVFAWKQRASTKAKKTAAYAKK